MERLLDAIERAGIGSRPAVLSSALIAMLVLLSQVLHWLGAGATYLRINPHTHEVEEVTAKVQGLLSTETSLQARHACRPLRQ